MPHITVDYCATLADTFDRAGFGRALHALIAKTVDGSAASCKTRFRQVEEYVMGDGATDIAMVHIEVGLLSGRTPVVKERLSKAVLDLVRSYVTPSPDYALHASVDVSDLDRGSYTSHKDEEPASA